MDLSIEGASAAVAILCALISLGCVYANLALVDQASGLRRTVLAVRDDVDACERSMQLTRDAVKRIEGRYAKREQAERATDELPNPERDPEGWKKAVNLKIIQRNR